MLVNDLDKFDMILQAYEYETGEREREVVYSCLILL